MKSKIIFVNLIFLILLSATAAQAALNHIALETKLYAHSGLEQTDPKQAVREEAALLAVTITPEAGWYAYAPAPDDPFVRPPSLKLKHGGKALANFLPPGKTKPDPLKPGEMVEVYDTATTFFIPVPQGAAGTTLSGLFTAVLCDGSKCILPRHKVSIELPDDFTALPPLPGTLLASLREATATDGSKLPGPAPAPASALAPTADKWNFTPRSFSPALEVSGLAYAVVLGLLAGLILNVMPCVLPVVSLKLSALMSGAGEEDQRERERRFREHNLFFGLGAMAWFALLALLLGLGGLAWGELFQSAWVVGSLAALLLLLALSLLGLFHLPVIDLKFDQGVSHPKLKAFATGMVATLLATPCSGPLLGGVLGWALLRPGGDIAVVFFAIGLGMASPYFLMIAFPGLVRFFPKPGPWLAHVEKAVALFLLAAVIYLASILPDPGLPTFGVFDLGLVGVLGLLWCAGAAVWLWRLAGSTRGKLIARSLALALLLGGGLVFLTPGSNTDPWTAFDPDDFKARLGSQAMALDFTADWCPTCKVLEATVLTDAAVQAWSEKYGVVFIRADLTKSAPRTEALLKKLGSQSIPLVAIFPEGEDALSPVLIRDLFTASQLEQALRQTTTQ